MPDKARAERYSVFGDALYTNPDLRFPNLDKVLPLPPAPLPKWDSNKQTLIDAAKAVVPVMPSSISGIARPTPIRRFAFPLRPGALATHAAAPADRPPPPTDQAHPRRH